MILNYVRASFHPLHPSPSLSQVLRRTFASSSQLRAKNRLYNSPRSADEWSTLLLLSTSSRRPLITLWTTARCSSCAAVLPLVRSLIEDEGVGEAEGGVGFAEVEVDNILMGGGTGVAVDYGVCTAAIECACIVWLMITRSTLSLRSFHSTNRSHKSRPKSQISTT